MKIGSSEQWEEEKTGLVCFWVVDLLDFLGVLLVLVREKAMASDWGSSSFFLSTTIDRNNGSDRHNDDDFDHVNDADDDFDVDDVDDVGDSMQSSGLVCIFRS